MLLITDHLYLWFKEWNLLPINSMLINDIIGCTYPNNLKTCFIIDIYWEYKYCNHHA